MTACALNPTSNGSRWRPWEDTVMSVGVAMERHLAILSLDIGI